MANSVAILQKLARDAGMFGLTVVSQSQTAVVISNGSNNLTIGYQNASMSPSVIGGIDPTVSPFLGIGVGNPGKLTLTSSIHTNVSMADILDSAVAAQVFAMMSGMANDILLSNDNASFTASVRGQADVLGMGQ